MRMVRILAAGVLLAAASTADVQLFVDSAPNVYGSPDWGPWWAATKADVAGGTFTDMRTGLHPGTHDADPYDFIVYSTGDLGKRLHWIYWVPGETTSSLDGRFEVKWVVDWDGDNWTWDWNTNSWVLDDPNAGWIQPASWEDYSGGVIGSFGFAWWATDDDAPPFDTGGSPYDETNQADIDALRSEVLAHQTFLTGYVRTRASASDPWQITTLNVTVVPSPSAALLGLIGMVTAGRMRRSA